MGEAGGIKFSSEGMEGIIKNYQDEYAAIARYQQAIEEYINVIRNNWTDSSENLTGREKDLQTIHDNLVSIRTNVDSLIKFLRDKKTNFEKINYKF